MSIEDASRSDSVHRGPRADDSPDPVPLVDLSRLSLAQLRTADSPELASCLARLIREAIDPGEVTSGFTAVV